ncbi:hypothetical protein BGZ89_002705 [Linnemannia elongata]|nr:hypothetical protein BGZ89_002705 [Linnemannia elongata]
MALPVRSLRLWLLFVTFVNLAFVTVDYPWSYALARGFNNALPDDKKKPLTYSWKMFAIIISSVFLFFAYLYAVLGKKPLVHRFVRAALMLVPALFLLGIMFPWVDASVQVGKMMGKSMFTCWYWPDDLINWCRVDVVHHFIAIITGIFVAIEVFITLLSTAVIPDKEDV